jgi:4-hydroxybenzoate polyprenyltransferase
VGAVATVAGAAPDAALRLGLAMTLLQLGIGTVNDLVDAPRDVGRKPGKPIPAGLVSPGLGLGVAVGSFGGGVLLGVAAGPAVGALALVVIAIGLTYDLRLKGSAWSWLPFAVGIPILPVFGWLGATGGLVPAFAILVPAAVAGGAALAISNSLVDVERDRAAGVSSVAAALGAGIARTANQALVAGIAIVAAASAAVLGAGAQGTIVIGVLGAVPVVVALGGAGDATRRELAWRGEAIGLGLLAVAWIGIVLG